VNGLGLARFAGELIVSGCSPFTQAGRDGFAGDAGMGNGMMPLITFLAGMD
jgi:hypothetical protein